MSKQQNLQSFCYHLSSWDLRMRDAKRPFYVPNVLTFTVLEHWHAIYVIWQNSQCKCADIHVCISYVCRPFCFGLNVLNFPVELHQGRVSLRRQVCHHCLPQRLSLWQPPPGPGVPSLPAHWHLGLGAPNCNECPNILLSTCSSVHVLLPWFYVIDCLVMWSINYYYDYYYYCEL